MKKQEIYFDDSVRVVALPNLKAICARISGICHRFEVDRMTGNYCYVRYSNPDEYGIEHPIIAVYPIVQAHGTMAIALHMVRCIGAKGEEDQAFDQLETHPELWHPVNGEGWRTTSETLAGQCAWWGIAGSILMAGFVHTNKAQGEPWKTKEFTGGEWESYCHKAWRNFR